MDQFENAVKTLKLSFLENTHKIHSRTSAYNFRGVLNQKNSSFLKKTMNIERIKPKFLNSLL